MFVGCDWRQIDYIRINIKRKIDMKLFFEGELSEIKTGIKYLQNRLGYEVTENGIPVKAVKGNNGIRVFGDESGAVIEYERKIDFFRGLGLLVEALKDGGKFDISQKANFKTDGMMIDCSRNSVMTVESIKKLLEMMAAMGLNMLMLYTEDTYEVEGYPYFGYMRGRYTHKELKECDDYAYELGIEMVPCIQTLAHLFSALKWDSCGVPKDTEDVLMIGDEKTYKFIEDIIKAASMPYRSNKIHIGMDEAFGLGRGEYLRKNGYRETFDIMCEHLDKVKNIAIENGLEPMIWSDMFFMSVSKKHMYYDTEIEYTEDMLKRVPKDVSLVYWDYQHEEQEHYEKMIDIHRKLGSEPIFAGGILTWIGMAVNYDITFVCATAALKACREKNIEHVLGTCWGDDGAETNIFSALLGMQLYAEYGYTQGEVTKELLKKRFKVCTGGNMDDFLAITKLDCITEDESKMITDTSNPCKYLLFGDVLLGLFDKHVEDYPISEYYGKVAELLKTAKDRAGDFDFVFDMPLALAEALVEKSVLGLKITKSYKEKDCKELEKICNETIPNVKKLVDNVRIKHREQWLKTYKPFGWEVLDCRYGGVLSRLETTAFRLSQFINGEVENIPELDEERLGYEMNPRSEELGFGRVNTYSRMISAGAIVLHK